MDTKIRDRSGIIYKTTDNKYLVVKEVGKPQYWGFPKGGQEENETAEQTAIREIYEEIGRRENERLLHEKIVVFADKDDAEKPTRKYTFFLLHVENPFECTINLLEIAAFKWVTLSELKKLRKASFTNSVFRQLLRLEQRLVLAC
jgi:8-oxo-dGTP pyrophosphatase MutT (NUDIX family)